MLNPNLLQLDYIISKIKKAGSNVSVNTLHRNVEVNMRKNLKVAASEV